MFGDNFFITNGWDTKRFRDDNHIEKDHDIGRVLHSHAAPWKEGRFWMCRKTALKSGSSAAMTGRNIHCQKERAYKLDGKTVAKNRRKRTEQKGDSLAEWYEKTVKKYGKREADRMRSQPDRKKKHPFLQYTRKDTAGNGIYIPRQAPCDDRAADRRKIPAYRWL